MSTPGEATPVMMNQIKNKNKLEGEYSGPSTGKIMGRIEEQS